MPDLSEQPTSTSSSSSTTPPPPSPQKTYLILDTAPLIKRTPLHHLATNFITIPEVLQELKDKTSLETLASLHLNLHLETRSPDETSMKAVIAFAKLTGDLHTLSLTDLKVLALTYMVEREMMGSVEHLRSKPVGARIHQGGMVKAVRGGSGSGSGSNNNSNSKKQNTENIETQTGIKELEEKVSELSVHDSEKSLPTPAITPEPLTAETPIEGKSEEPEQEKPTEDDDQGGWITPKNIHKHKLRSFGHTNKSSTSLQQNPHGSRVSCMTADFAMQNVLMQMGLQVLGLEGILIKRVKSWVLRCHACYKVTSQTDTKFCPSCGNNTLMRTSCSVEEDGTVTYYLKSNFQYNLRGTKYSIPTHKGGRDASKTHILTPDQKEYMNLQKAQQKYVKKMNAISEGFESLDYNPLQHHLAFDMPRVVIGHGRKNVNEVRGRRGKNRK